MSVVFNIQRGIQSDHNWVGWLAGCIESWLDVLNHPITTAFVISRFFIRIFIHDCFRNSLWFIYIYLMPRYESSGLYYSPIFNMIWRSWYPIGLDIELKIWEKSLLHLVCRIKLGPFAFVSKQHHLWLSTQPFASGWNRLGLI